MFYLFQKMFKYITLCWFALHLIYSVSGYAQVTNPNLFNSPWEASWIEVPDEPTKDYGVYLFRKQVILKSKPDSFIIHISADNRYKLYVNQKLVSLGPSRSDIYYWNYETVDIAPYLKSGENIIGAVVWNGGDLRPEAQISLRTGLIIQGNTARQKIINTDDSWKCIKNKAYSPLNGIGYRTYYVAGSGELVDMNHYPMHWLDSTFDDTYWLQAAPIANGVPKGVIWGAKWWMLVPSKLPQMELTVQRLAKLRKAEGIKVTSSFPETDSKITIPPNTKVTLLLDQGYLTNAYFTLHFSNGKNAGIGIGYAESLFKEKPSINHYSVVKGNRNTVEGYYFAGRRDSIVSNGTTDQKFTTLDWRTYRYVQLSITTQEHPLIIEDIYGTFTGYPFKYNAKFITANKELDKMLEIGWRTARLCAFETYMDCPYYEQLQYIGDTRIQALVSFYNSGDDRLVRNALEQMDHSRIAEGITLSRHPSYTPQQISTFSLWYVGMLHDYWMYRPDAAFVKDKLNGVRGVLGFFSQYQEHDGSLKNVPYWLFTDWVKGNDAWTSGVGPIGKTGTSSILDLQLLWAYQLASKMEKQMGIGYYADLYKKKSHQLENTIRASYWDSSKGLFADTQEKKLFSQHANSLAILTGVVKDSAASIVAQNMLSNKDLAPASIYFKFYLHMALVKAGLGNEYLNWLGKWRENMRMGLTTWAENSSISTSRSDCHAWGASPNIEFFRTVLGVDSAAPGFGVVKVKPHLGDFKKAYGEIPHPNGKLTVAYELVKNKWKVTITLPKNTTGYLIWEKERINLTAGINKINP